jgi:hypothetical protein
MTLIRAEIRALAALAAVSLALAIGYALSGSASAGAVTFQVAFVIGLAPVVIYGAPTYAWMQQRRALTWPRVVLLGALPGILSLPFALTLGLVALAAGVAVSCVTHRLSKRDGE